MDILRQLTHAFHLVTKREKCLLSLLIFPITRMHTWKELSATQYLIGGSDLPRTTTHNLSDGSSLERVSMKAITLVQTLLLQKPSRRSKTKEHVCHLKRRLDLWSKGDIQQLSLFRLDIQDAAGPLQVCAGQDGGCEAAVHARYASRNRKYMGLC